MTDGNGEDKGPQAVLIGQAALDDAGNIYVSVHDQADDPSRLAAEIAKAYIELALKMKDQKRSPIIKPKPVVLRP